MFPPSCTIQIYCDPTYLTEQPIPGTLVLSKICVEKVTEYPINICLKTANQALHYPNYHPSDIHFQFKGLAHEKIKKINLCGFQNLRPSV